MLFKSDNPYLSVVTASPLSKALKHTLDIIATLPVEIIYLSLLKKTVNQNSAKVL